MHIPDKTLSLPIQCRVDLRDGPLHICFIHSLTITCVLASCSLNQSHCRTLSRFLFLPVIYFIFSCTNSLQISFKYSNCFKCKCFPLSIYADLRVMHCAGINNALYVNVRAQQALSLLYRLTSFTLSSHSFSAVAGSMAWGLADVSLQ